MNIAADRRQFATAWRETALAGHRAVLDPRGALVLPELDMLVVSDLHLEKGSSFARRGRMLPPYDSAATLAVLGAVIADHDPAMVVSLGDSFHDRAGSARLPQPFRDTLLSLMRGREWIWVTGNHDPDAPQDLPGATALEVAAGRLVLRHEPGPGRVEGEIAGHLHPGAMIVERGRAVRRRCFASDGSRLVMPAFGAFTGMLNVLDGACRGLFDWPRFTAHMLGAERVYAIAGRRLRR
jgi:DNA ligase-associated metallophosphoesterase